MTVNTINYTVEANGVTPAVIKSGGVQGDHNVTKLVFSLPQSFVDVLFSNIPEGEKLYYRFDGYSGANVMRSTEAIELTKSGANGVELSYFLENWITKDGGNVVVNLVLVHINTDVETESELYCFPVSLSLKARSGRAAYNEAFKSITSAELVAKEAAERAGIYEQGAISAMDQSNEYARKSEEQALAAKESADSAAEKLEEFKNFEKLSIDQTYNPKSSNAQSGKAVAEAFDLLLPQISGVYDPNSDLAMNGQAVAQAISGKMDKFAETEQTAILTPYGKTVVTDYELMIGAKEGGCFMSSPYSPAGIYSYPYDGSLTMLELYTPDYFAPYAAANMLYVDTAIGSIETALDSIIAIQKTLIGGGN